MFKIKTSYIRYNNADMKVTKDSEIVNAEFSGRTIKSAMDRYRSAANLHDLAQNTPIQIYDVVEE